MDHKNLNFFGSYLTEKGVISQEALQEAIAFQEESNRRIGELARERGYITKDQAEAIFREQRLVDQPFGTIALKHKYLTRSQLDDLLFAQTVYSTHLGEALLIKGYLTPEQFSEELEAFRDKQVQREQLLESFFRDLPEKDILQSVVSSTNRAYVRFAGRELKLDSVCFQLYQLFEVCFKVAVRTQEKGTVSANFYLTKTLAQDVAHGFLESGATGSEQDSIAALTAFFEIVERYLQVALSEQGYTCYQGEVAGGILETAQAVAGEEGLVMQLVTPSGAIVLHALVECAEDSDPCP